MKIIQTIFDYKQDHPLPLYSAIYDNNNNKSIKFLPLYLKGLKTKLSTVFANLELLQETINQEEVVVNDLCSLLYHFRNEIKFSDNIYENSRIGLNGAVSEIDAKKKICKSIITIGNVELWMKVKARSAFIYSILNKTSLLHGPYVVNPIYNTHTFTGRSKTKSFNIQGTNSQDPLRPTNNHKYFICLDWVSADIRMMSILSGDEDLLNKIDPYSYVAEILSDKDFILTRNECKNELLKSIYSLNLDTPILDMFPTLKDWIELYIEKYAFNYDYCTILGMPIPKKNPKSSFNAIIQGSVAEAIQNSIFRIGSRITKYLMTETHDSIIMTSPRNKIDNISDFCSKIMMNPFKDLDININMPVNVSIGTKWKQWKNYRTVKNDNTRTV